MPALCGIYFSVVHLLFECAIFYSNLGWTLISIDSLLHTFISTFKQNWNLPNCKSLAADNIDTLGLIIFTIGRDFSKEIVNKEYAGTKKMEETPKFNKGLVESSI